MRSITIDIEARFQDNVTTGAGKATSAIDKLGQEAQETQQQLDNLTKKKPIFDADTSKFLKKLREIEARNEKLGRSKTTVVLKALDKATNVIGKVLNKGQSLANKTWTALVKVKNSEAMAGLKGIVSQSKNIAGKTWSAIVKVKDLATSPLKRIKDSLFSIKSLIGTIVAGAAVKQAMGTLVSSPVGLADSIESARIAFETNLGSASAAEDFLQQIYKFDEKSPFDTTEIVGITQQMMNLGWTAENVLEDLGTIGDWSASLGKGTDGISAVTRALGQMRMKGKLSSEKMLQLTEAGVDGWNYLADYLGKDIVTIREMAEDGLIDVDTAIKGIMSGMSEYSGSAAATADRTISGLKDQIGSLFKTYVALPWGEGLSSGFKDALTKVRDIIDENKDSLKAFGEELKVVGEAISSWFADKVETAVGRFKEITGSAEFKNANAGDKLKMVWSGVIANPLAQWWDSTVVPWWNSTAVPWLAEKAAEMGEAIGRGLTSGLLALFGASDTLVNGAEQGSDIAGSFVEGFVDGFDGSAITEAITSAFNDVWSALPWWAKGIVIGKGLGSVGTVVGGIGSLVGGVKTFAGNAGKVWGSTGNSMVKGTGLGNVLAGAGYKLTGGAAASGLSGGAAAAVGGGSILGGIAGAAGVGSGIIDIYQGTQTTGKEKQDNYFKGGTKLALVGGGAAAGAKLGATVGTAAGGPIGTAAGALIGAGVGGVGALFGGDKLGTWLSDKKDQVMPWLSEKKEQAGTWLSEKKDSATSWLKKKYYGDAYDEETGKVDMGWMGDTGGWIDKVNQLKELFTETIPEKWDEFCDTISDFFTETIPEAAELAGEKISTFFTETIPEKWGELCDTVGEFFTETIPDAAERVGEKISTFFTETIPETWDGFMENVKIFLFEKVPYALGYVTGKVTTFFTETVPGFFATLWDTVSTFFTETVPEWAEGIWNNHIYPFFTETIPTFFGTLWSAVTTFFTETVPEWAESIWDNHIYPFFTETIPGFFGALWSAITTFFTETLPEWAEGIWNDHIYPFFTETIPSFFSSLWNTISTFFSETLPEWAEGIWNNHVRPFFTETIPSFFSSLWDTISTFFTETIPEWAEGIWNNNIVPFFTETIPGFFSPLWDSVTTFFTESLPSIAEAIWGAVKGFFTETIPGWVSSAIENAKANFNTIKENFLSGFSDGSGDGDGKKARGGIVGGPSAMEAFARGGFTGNAGIVGGSTKFIRVNEEAPEMIIPLSSQRRDRALKLWSKTGEMLGVPGFARGGSTGGQDEGLRFHRYGSDEPAGGQTVHIEVGGITFEINVNATDGQSVVEAIKAQAEEIAETVAGIMADAFGAQFENTPVRGGA